MYNKFGLKDFVILLAVLLVGVGVVLAMIQDDRRFEQNRDLLTKVGTLEKQLARVERTLENGVVARAATGTPGTPAARDESWARPGVEIAWQPVPDYTIDPTAFDDYEPGGEFVEIFEAQMPKIMPHLAQDVYSRRITDLVFDRLGDYSTDTKALVGSLAEAWQYDPDGMWLRVKLRDNARFHDGETVNADDVQFTWMDFIFNPELETERVRSIVNNVEDVTAISDKVVEFTFKSPLYSNLSVALLYDILPKHFYERFTPAQINQSTGLLMGSGPFRAESIDPSDQWSPGTDFVLVRNESYWGGGKPALDRLRFRTITEDLASFTAYKNGEADMMRPTSAQFTETLANDPDWEQTNQSLNWVNMRSGYSFIAWQCGKRNGERLRPFHDQRVRLAMTHLLDRQLLIDDVSRGIGQIATGPNNSTSPASAPDVTPWPYDLAKARELLADAGWEDRDGDNILENEAGEEFEWEYTYAVGSDSTVQLANYVQAQCALVGIRMTHNPIDWSIFVEVLNSRDFDAISLAWSASSPESDPRQIWHSASIENQGDNFTQWASADADRLIDKGRATLSDPERMLVWHELHRVLHEEQPYTFLREIPWLRFVSGEFKNVNPYSKGLEQREFYAVPMSGI